MDQSDLESSCRCCYKQSLVSCDPVCGPLLCELLTLMGPLAQKRLLRELPGIDVAQEPEGEGREGEGESGKGERMNRGPEEKM